MCRSRKLIVDISAFKMIKILGKKERVYKNAPSSTGAQQNLTGFSN
jgi:hypothetical protein